MTKEIKITPALKLEIIQSADKIGLRQTEKIYGITKKTIIGWRKKYRELGEIAFNTFSRENQQHPSRISESIRAKIRKLFYENPALSAAQIIKTLNLSCSIPSVLKIIRHKNISISKQQDSTWYLNAAKTTIFIDEKPVYLLTATEKNSGITLPCIVFENIPIYLNGFTKYTCNFLFNSAKQTNYKIVTINGRFRSGNNKNPVDAKLIQLFPNIDFLNGNDDKMHAKTVRNLIKSLPETINDQNSILKILYDLIFRLNLTKIIDYNLFNYFFLLGFNPVVINLDFCHKSVFLDEKTALTSELIAKVQLLLLQTIKNNDLKFAESLLGFLRINSDLITDPLQKIRQLQMEGDWFLKKYQYPKAKEKYLQAAALAKTNGNLEIRLSVDLDLAYFYFTTSRFKRSEYILNRAIQIASANRLKVLEAELLAQLGRVYQVNNNPLTLTIYEKLLTIALELDDKNLYCSALTKLAGYYLKTAEFDKCLQTAEKCLTLAEKNHELLHVYNSVSKIGECYLFVHKFDLAEKSFAYAKQIMEKIGIKKHIIDATLYLGYAQFKLKKVDLGVENMEKALAQSRQIENIYREQLAYAMLGQSYQLVADFKKAIYYFNKAIKINLIIGNIEHLATIYANLITSFNELGKYSEALKYAELRYELVKSSKNKFQIATSIGKIGSCALNLQNYSLATVSYNQQLKLLKGSNAEFQKAIALSNLGHIYLETKDYTQAKFYYVKAGKIFAKIDDDKFLMRIYLQLVEVSKQSGNFKDLKKYTALSNVAIL